MPNQDPGAAWVVNAAIEQLDTIGPSTFLTLINQVDYWRHPDRFPWPVRFEPPPILDTECLDNCLPPEITPDWCGEECDCPDALAEAPEGNTLLFGELIQQIQLDEEESDDDAEVLLQAAWDFLVQNMDIVTWLECALNIREGCVSEFLLNAEAGSVSVELATGLQVTTERTGWPYPWGPLFFDQTKVTGLEVSEEGNNPIEMTFGQLRIVGSDGDADDPRDDTWWAWLEAYKDAQALPDEFAAEKAAILGCVLTQVAASLLGALVSGLDCAKTSSCEDVENRISNAFMWAVAQRFPCVTEWGGCLPYTLDVFWMNPGTPFYPIGDPMPSF